MFLQEKKNSLLKESDLCGVALWRMAKSTEPFIHLSYAVPQAERR